MKLVQSSNNRLPASQPVKWGLRSRAAFTMIEIAIALGVIGFALVAIVGLLPYGLSTQKDNREDTIINQDSAYYLEAIRSGSKGLDDLTNFVEFITIVTRSNGPSGPVAITNRFTYHTGPMGYLYGDEIVGLLSYPKYILDKDGFAVITNCVTAQVRAMSGSALDLQDSEGVVGFRYQLTPEIIPFGTDPARQWTNMLYDLRLRFEWPLVGADKGQLGKLSKRPRSTDLSTLISGDLSQTGDYYYFDKQQHVK